MTHMKINGTYPHDSREFPWMVVKQLDLEEVIALLHPPEELVKEVKEGGYHERWGWRRFLFINKGYVTLPLETGAEPPKISSATAGALDAFLQVETPTPVGTRAVYMHDGKYSLIERVAPIPH